MTIQKDQLKTLYTERKLSAVDVANILKCSPGKVNYWLARHKIKKRSIADATYAKRNPLGDPFVIKKPKNDKEAFLYGLGVGLYWGEGTKSNKTSVRLGNSDPRLIKKFVVFLERLYGIKKEKLRFGLQIFGDMEKEAALQLWMKALGVGRSQFLPSIVVTPHRGVGNYRRKTESGVVTVYFNNRKLRDILCGTIEEIAME